MPLTILSIVLFTKINRPLSTILLLYFPQKHQIKKKYVFFVPFIILVSMTLGLIFAVGQRLFRPVKRIRVGRLHSGRLGHLILEFDWYATSRNMGNKSEDTIDFFYFSEAPCNEFASKFISENLNMLPKFVMLWAYLINRLAKADQYLVPLPTRPNNLTIFDDSPSNFKFSPEQVRRAHDDLRKLGARDLDRLICVYVRDGAYESTLKNVSREFSSYRNSKFSNYELAIREMIANGYTVVRMGNVVSHRFSYEDLRFIDYANSNYKSDLLDFYIPSIAKFIIGTDSGTMMLPIAFRKPFALPNIPALHGLPVTKYLKFYQFKDWVDSRSGQEIGLQEYVNRGCVLMDSLSEFSAACVSFKENSPEEILALFKVMERYFANSDKYSYSRSEHNHLVAYLSPLLKGYVSAILIQSWLDARPYFIRLQY